MIQSQLCSRAVWRCRSLQPNGIGSQNSCRQLVAVDLAGDVTRVEVLDLVGQDAAFIAHRPSCKIRLAFAANALSLVDRGVGGGRGQGAS